MPRHGVDNAVKLCRGVAVGGVQFEHASARVCSQSASQSRAVGGAVLCKVRAAIGRGRRALRIARVWIIQTCEQVIAVLDQQRKRVIDLRHDTRRAGPCVRNGKFAICGMRAHVSLFSAAGVHSAQRCLRRALFERFIRRFDARRQQIARQRPIPLGGALDGGYRSVICAMPPRFRCHLFVFPWQTAAVCSPVS